MKILLYILIFQIALLEIFSRESFLDSLADIQKNIDENHSPECILRDALTFDSIVKHNNLEEYKAKSLQNLGVANWYNNENIIAVDYLYESIEKFEASQNYPEIVTAYIYLGLINAQNYNYDIAEQVYKKVYQISYEHNLAYEKAVANWNLAFIYQVIQKPDLGISYYYPALEILKSNDFSDYQRDFGLFLTYFYGGTLYETLAKYDSSAYVLNLAIKHSENISVANILPTVYEYLAKVILKQNYADSALTIANKAVETSIKSDNYEYIRDAYNTLSEIYEYKKNSDSALKYHKLCYRFADSVYINDARVISAKYELQSSQDDFDRKAKQSERIIFIGIISAVILIIFLVLIYSRYKIKQKYSEQLKSHIDIKNKFFRIISHDLKGPLSSFNTLSQLLLEDFDSFDKSEIKTQLQKIEKSSNQIYNLLLNLLKWAEVQTGSYYINKTNFNIADIIQEVAQIHENEYSLKEISIEFILEQHCSVYSDENMTEGILRNLISNAIKFTPNRGKIIIRSQKQNSYCRIEITDTGTGISNEDKLKIFKIDEKLSRRGTNNENGSGLGLNLAKEFVYLNDGEIAFHSELSKGTTFWFTLPLSKNLE